MDVDDVAGGDGASDSSTEELLSLGRNLELLKMLQMMKDMEQPAVNPPCPFPKLTGAQWVHLNLSNKSRCKNNLRMSPDAFLHLHDILATSYGLESTSQCESKEALAMFIWTCGHASAVREAQDRFQRSLDTISRKCTLVAELILRWANTIICPSDPEYREAHISLQRFCPWFDGCIGAIDGTHIPVEVKSSRKLDYINRKHCVSLNVCAVVDMHGLFTYVGAGMAGSCHDMRVLEECMQQRKFPTPPKGRYYLADSGYADKEGYMVPFQGNKLHLDHFKGVDLGTLGKEENFNYHHASLGNIIERRFGNLKERWKILEGVPFMPQKKQATMIIACFAMDNFLWRRHYGTGERYALSDRVHLNADMSTSALRELTATMLYDPQG